nr:MAG TPA: hypothetical protein [Caudoviricetes sp.]
MSPPIVPPSSPNKRSRQHPPLPPPQNGHKKAAIVGDNVFLASHRGTVL